MEEQNKNIENQQPENENNETAIQTKKPIPKKTIIIASIVAAVAIIATIVCIIAFGKSPEEKAVIGDWYTIDEEGEYIKFSKDRTGTLMDDGVVYYFEWEYDSEKEKYTLLVAGRKTTITMRTEENLTFLTGFGSYFFRENDCEIAITKVPAFRDNYISRNLKDKKMLPLQQELSSDDINITFNDVQLAENKESIICNISVTAKRDISYTDLNNLIQSDKYTYFAKDYNLICYQRLGSKINLVFTNSNLSAGECINVDVVIISDSNFPDMLNKWGTLHGYVMLNFDGNEYYINLTDYIKE